MQQYALRAISRDVSAPPKTAVAVVRSGLRLPPSGGTRDGGQGFALRLLVGFIVTLALVELVGLTIIGRNAQSSQIEQYAAMQRSDVRMFESIGRHSLTTASALIEIDSVLDVLAKRPGTIEAQVFDEQGVILASGEAGVIGTRDGDPRIAAVIRTGDAYAGHEGDPKRDQRDFEFIAPVRLASGSFAYEVTYEHASFDAELATVRRASSWSAAAASWRGSSSSTSSAVAASSAGTARRWLARRGTG